MLSWFRFQLTGRWKVRNKGDMYVHDPLSPQFVSQLAYSLQEWQAFDITHGTADLTENEILIGEVIENELLNCIGNVRNYLNRGAQIVAVPLPGNDIRIDFDLS